MERNSAPMVWHGWGDPTQRRALPDHLQQLLARQLGGLGEPAPPVSLDDVRIAPSCLTPAQHEALAGIVGAGNVRTDHQTRVEHAGGKSYPDLVRRRTGDALAAPDAVVFPATAGEVQRLLAACVEHRVAVVPFGGGTSVVGGVEPERGGFAALVTVDLSGMHRLLDLDTESGIATFEPGIRGVHAEEALRERGFTLGHFPQSYEYATVGGFVVTRSAGQTSTGYGRIDEMVVGARVATPVGELRVGFDTASAAGPDLLQLVVGSEGTLGIVTEVSLRVRPAPAESTYAAWAVPTFADGATLLRDLVQSGAAPDLARLSDPDETRLLLAQAGSKAEALQRYLRARRMPRACLLILGWDGDARDTAVRRRQARRVRTRHTALSLPSAVGRAWVRSRFAGAYLRDELMDRGVFVETLETATRWSQLDALYAAVRDALAQSLTARGTPPLVLCHISHLYDTGASLYFTWLARAEAGSEIEQWRAAKTAASDAIVAAGGTITHHHAVGLDHREWMPAEIGDLGVQVLTAVKSVLDPTGVLNPRKLLP